MAATAPSALQGQGKYVGLKPLSETDKENIAEGKESTLDQTGRLFYVCCTRALTDLAVVLFATDVPAAIAGLRERGIFPEAEIRSLQELTAV